MNLARGSGTAAFKPQTLHYMWEWQTPQIRNSLKESGTLQSKTRHEQVAKPTLKARGNGNPELQKVGAINPKH